MIAILLFIAIPKPIFHDPLPVPQFASVQAEPPPLKLQVWTSKRCTACRSPRWLRALEQLEQLTDIKVVAINADTYHESAEKQRIHLLPTSQLLQRRSDGEYVEALRWEGALTLDHMMELTERFRGH